MRSPQVQTNVLHRLVIAGLDRQYGVVYPSLQRSVGLARKGRHTLQNTIKYRALIHAIVYAPAQAIPRDQATGLYNALAEEVFPGLGFKYTPEDRAKGRESPFKIEMVEEKRGERNLVVIDVPGAGGGQSLRVLVQQLWPESSNVACQRADAVYERIREVVGSREMQLAETRIRAQVATGQRRAVDFVAASLSGDKRAKLGSLGNVQHLGLAYECEPVFPVTEALGGAKRTVKAEPLREEKGWLYLEVMSQWGRRAVRPAGGDASQALVVPGPLELEVCQPSRYIEDTMAYTTETLCPFLEELP